ncbi:hypothetical protein ACHAW5_002273 [Stephanodiscus triporus]|uniref:Uncharacterized protein n=1 Tax=Stephanodiscus triporus TaxID=2934178 RepID=A0ABD3NE16_9STRA
MAKNDKKGALFSLKLKKMYKAELDKIANMKLTLETQMYEAELDKIANIKMTLETLVMNLESIVTDVEVLKLMDAGKQEMERMRKDTDIEKVDDLMDEIKEEMEAAAEISGALAQPIDPLLTDEDDLLAELEQLSADAALGAPVIKAQPEEEVFPTVPSKKLPAIANASEKEAEELAELEAELAGMM